MCGRFTFQPTEAFYARFEISNRLDGLVPRYNIAPGQMVPVIIANSPRHIVLMRWGLIPQWAKDAKTAYKMINARVETLTQRPACGYYEWQGEGREKTPYYIHPQEDQFSRLLASTMSGGVPTARSSAPSRSSQQRQIPSWRGCTTACQSSWRERWKRPGSIQR